MTLNEKHKTIAILFSVAIAALLLRCLPRETVVAFAIVSVGIYQVILSFRKRE